MMTLFRDIFCRYGSLHGRKAKLLPAIVFLAAAVLLNGCAKVGTPTGGPRDVTPPVVLYSEPQNHAVNFNGKSIEVVFDEFITLQDLNEELMISPPLENRPVIRVNGRTLVINLNNELEDSTTYTLDFGNAIADNNEGNVLPGFEFVFSTGSYLDSLAITGETMAAFDHATPGDDGDFYIMAYENLNDSAPLLELPRYIGNINENGLFSINNMHADTFRVLVLQDANNNLRYDRVTDGIAFADSFIVVTPATVNPLYFVRDTVNINDSLVAYGTTLNAVNLKLYYFHEIPDKVFLSNRSRESDHEILLTFTRPPYDSVTIDPLNFTAGQPWFIREASRHLDTLRYWITDTTVSNREMLELRVNFTTTDSMGLKIPQHDTVQLMTRAAAPSANARRPQAAQPGPSEDRLTLSSGLASVKTLNLNGIARFTASQPVSLIDTGRIRLLRMVDSLETEQPFQLVQDTASVRRFSITSSWVPESQYRLELLPQTVTSIYDQSNDSLTYSFTTQAMEYYGSIQLTIQSPVYPLIVQVIDSRGGIVHEDYVENEETLNISYLPPGTYIFKAIHDRNGNHEWDTGDYLRQIQPETTYFHESVAVRSNWDYELTWKVY